MSNSRFFDKLFEIRNQIKIIATGATHNTVYKVLHPEDDTDKKFLEIIKTLLWVTFTGGIAKIIQGIGGTQMIGLTGATLDKEGNLCLLGHCLEANKPPPQKDEDQVGAKLLEPINTEDVDKWLIYAKSDKPTKSSKNILEYLTPPIAWILSQRLGTKLSKDILVDLFRADNDRILVKEKVSKSLIQVGIWVITDDIPLSRVKTELYGHLEFFTTQHLEVLLILTKHLINSGVEIRNKKYLRDLLFMIIHNHNIIPRSLMDIWSLRYSLQMIISKKSIIIRLKLKEDQILNLEIRQ